ncbi:MAG TPA: hypothetical protein VJO33_00060 [Gemmatimonadaceae bacterium]|nr:hypothetical protein [Gemmatimonadaceae bacterium]
MSGVGRWALRVARWALRCFAMAIALVALNAARSTLNAQRTHLLIISGLGGEPQYAEQFRNWGLALSDVARKRYAMPDSEVVYLAEEGSKDARIAGVSTKVNVEATLARFAKRAAPGDEVVIVLIGHGSGAQDDSKISLPGPDMSARDFARDLDAFKTQQVGFVDLTSASGDMLPILSAPNRVVITATKSSFERNESVFVRYFIAAFTGDGADVDKDGRISLLEAYRYAVTETKRYYDDQGRLQTEHAQLDDDGDKKGTADPDMRVASGDGALARRLFLGGSVYASMAGANDPRLAALYKERFTLEGRIEELKKRKATLSADAYDDALEDLLVELATKAKAIRAIEGRS